MTSEKENASDQRDASKPVAKSVNAISATSTSNGNGSGNGNGTPPRKANGTAAAVAVAADVVKSGSPKKRRKVNHACIYCRRSHMTCDLERPCTRCIKRNIGHLCHDEPREPPKKMRTNSLEQSPAAKPTADNSANTLLNPMSANGQTPQMPLPQFGENGGSTSLVQPTPVHASQPSVLGANNQTSMNFHNWMYGPQSQLSQDMHLLQSNSFFNTSEVSQEFSLLNDFLTNNLLDDGQLVADDLNGLSSTSNLTGAIGTLNAASHPFLSAQQSNQMLPPSLALGSEIVRPASGVPIDRNAKEKYLLMAADPTGSEAPEERLKKLLKAKYDAGMLKPFNYVKGYARMGQYMERHITAASRIRILKQLEKFRPKFRELIHPLTDEQLVYVEVGFERRLMEYDRIFSSMAIPACCWRRTGEIYRGNKEMAELIHVPMEQLRDGKIAIHELFAEPSLVMYWENFGSIAFDSSQKAILTTCALKNMNQQAADREIRCSFSFTIRRDQYNIPSLIVGNFLPILEPGK